MAARQAQEYQERIRRGSEIINRYDRFRLYVLDEVVPLLREWHSELLEVGAGQQSTVHEHNLAQVAAALAGLATEIQERGENPQ